MSVDPADCPLFEAPPCFRYALTRALEGATIDYTPTNWKGFSEYFKIKHTSTTSTPEELVAYWIDSHPRKCGHTVNAVRKFARHTHHKVLLDSMESLITGHLVPDYGNQPTSSECLRPCDECMGWNSEGNPTSQSEQSSRKISCEHHNHVNYNGTVIKHIYNFTSQKEMFQSSERKRKISEAQPSDTHSHTPRQSEEKSTEDKPSSQSDILQELGNRLFDDVFPYRHLQALYHGKLKEAIRVIVIIYLLYQGLAVMIMSVCENGGLLTIFQAEHNDQYTATVCRLIAFTLRFLLRVITPLCFSLHIPVMASKPLIPKTGLSQDQAIPRMFKVHENFSSEEEVVELRENVASVFQRSEEMTKRRIKAMWIPMTNAALLVTLLLYLGAFLVCETNTMKGGVCSSLDRTIVTLPFVNAKIHFLIVIESISVFSIFLLAGVAANCYYHENTIANYAVTIGKEAESLYTSVRRRWAVLDWYALLVPVMLCSVTALSISTGKPFTPAPTHRLEVTKIVDWYFWVVTLTVLQYLGFSSNRMLKSACLWGYLLSAVFVYWVEVEVAMVPYGSILVLLYCGISALCFNLLYSSCTCHLCHARETGTLSSYVKGAFCVFSLCLLVTCLIVTLYREIAHLTSFAHLL